MTLEAQVKFWLPLAVVMLASFFLWFDRITGDSWILLASAVVGAPIGVEGWKSYQLRKLQETAMSFDVSVPVPIEKKD